MMIFKKLADVWKKALAKVQDGYSVTRQHELVFCHLSKWRSWWLAIVFVGNILGVLASYYNVCVGADEYKLEHYAIRKKASESGSAAEIQATSYFASGAVMLAIASDVLFIVHLFIKYRTTFTDNTGALVCALSRIRKHHSTPVLILDLFFSSPWDIFGPLGWPREALGPLGTMRVFRHVWMTLSVVRRGGFAAWLLNVSLLVPVLAATLHMMWYLTGRIERDEYGIGWVVQLGIATGHVYKKSDPISGFSPRDMYAEGLYRVLGCFAIMKCGPYDTLTAPETVVMVVVQVVAVVTYGVIAIILGGLVISGCKRWKRQRNDITSIGSYYRLPGLTSARLAEYSRTWNQPLSQRGYITMPVDLAIAFPWELSPFAFAPGTALGKAFQAASAEQQTAVRRSCALVGFGEGTTLIKRGQYVYGVYFVYRGSLELRISNLYRGRVDAGEAFGDISNGNGTYRQSAVSVQATTDGELLQLPGEHLQALLRCLPNALVNTRPVHWKDRYVQKNGHYPWQKVSLWKKFGKNDTPFERIRLLELLLLAQPGVPKKSSDRNASSSSHPALDKVPKLATPQCTSLTIPWRSADGKEIYSVTVAGDKECCGDDEKEELLSTVN